MWMSKLFGLAVLAAVVGAAGSARAQFQPASGLYQIVSGRYQACCGIAGPLRYSLPKDDQAFVRWSYDPAGNVPRMEILGMNQMTVFRISSQGTGTGFSFSFSNGIVLPDRVHFGGFPSPEPGKPTFGYGQSLCATSLA